MTPSAGQGGTAQARRAKNAFRALQLGFLVLTVAVVAVGLWSVLQGRPGLSTVPREVAGYKRVRLFGGAEARRMVAMLHQGYPQVTEVWVAFYERGGSVWVGTTASIDAARGQVEATAQAIGKGGTPFSDLREISLAGRRLFTVSDTIGSLHYFFQDGFRVIWITPPYDSGLPFVEAVLGKL